MDHCALCNRDFASKESLDQHKRNSSVHNKNIRCKTCSCSFGTNEALQQHERDSPIHNKTFHCQNCKQSFGSAKTLKGHKKACRAASVSPPKPVDTLLHQGRVSRNIGPETLTVDPRSLLVKRLARMVVSEIPPTKTPHSQPGRKDVPQTLQKTMEFFMYPELHANVKHAVSPEISSTWFNEDDDNDFDCDDEWFTHVMGRFTCTNTTCKKRAWNSKKVPIEIRRYPDNGYSATVYNQRCKSCNQLGSFELHKRSYVERVAYRLKKWAGVEMEAPPNNGNEGPPHERAYCEGCRRGKCREGRGFERF